MSRRSNNIALLPRTMWTAYALPRGSIYSFFIFPPLAGLLLLLLILISDYRRRVSAGRRKSPAIMLPVPRHHIVTGCFLPVNYLAFDFHPRIGVDFRRRNVPPAASLTTTAVNLDSMANYKFILFHFHFPPLAGHYDFSLLILSNSRSSLRAPRIADRSVVSNNVDSLAVGIFPSAIANANPRADSGSRSMYFRVCSFTGQSIAPAVPTPHPTSRFTILPRNSIRSSLVKSLVSLL